MMWVDHWLAVCLIPLAIWTLVSGLDDLFVGLLSLFLKPERMEWPPESERDRTPERWIAILVPLWREHAVIGPMLERNLAAVRYSNYIVFAGVYPNDHLTCRAVKAAAKGEPRIQTAYCGHNGPTSKGDCLNWIYDAMQEYESRHAIRFEIIVTHDAEDLIHPDSLLWINRFSREYDMVQVPVLPFPTGLCEPTHGIYCDEFAEVQTKDIPVRRSLGGFLPSCGVGTGFSREVLDRLASERGGAVFDPACLTEDYENGFVFFLKGCRQMFLPIRFDGVRPMATREYFPRRFRAAVRQRSRWVAGIALQGWERHGWRVPRSQVYWLWRDRKGLIGNLFAPVANFCFLYGLLHSTTWAVPNWVRFVCALNLGIAFVQTGLRARASARVYGWGFASAVPLRMLWGNWVNCVAAAAALRQFFSARIRGRKLDWRKTDHIYPAHVEPVPDRPRVGELLVRMDYVSADDLERALQTRPAGVRLGEYLLNNELVAEFELYHALSRQAGIPMGLPEARDVDRAATRILPVESVRRWKVFPYRVSLGHLHLLTAEEPTAEMVRELAALSGLEPRFRLVRASELAGMQRRFLPPGLFSDAFA